MVSQPKASRDTDLASESITTEEVSPLAQTLPYQFRLTPREKEIALWICRGETNTAIAEILMISKRTVDKLIEHIFDKLGVADRTVLTSLVQQHMAREDSMD